jgi:dihydroorotase
MSILLKNVQIYDERSPDHLKKKNILIADDGIIQSIDQQEHTAGHVIEGKSLKVSIGWFDMWANFSDPGLEHKEDLESGRAAAAAGGFTGVALVPNTQPVIDSKNDISYLLAKNSQSITQIYPYGATTVGCEGTELTEMIDMHHAGAAAFTDGEQPIWNTDILHKSLLYLKKIDSLLINRPEEKHLTAYGIMNEGVTSTMLGMKGMPSIAEELMVRRDLDLLRYAGGKLHFANISTAGAVRLLRKARNEALPVSCHVAVHNLMWDDSALTDYDTNYKVNPPLRTASDIKALERGLKDGVIDAIASGHSPQDTESKNVEFDLADYGMIALQTFFPIINSICQKDDLQTYLNAFTTRPRVLLDIPVPSVEVGEQANLTVFDTSAEWRFDARTNRSRSQNSPLFGQKLKGRVLATINNGRWFICDK